MSVERRLDEIERRLRWVEDTRRTFDRRRTALWQGVRDLEVSIGLFAGPSTHTAIDGYVSGCGDTDGAGTPFDLSGATVSVSVLWSGGSSSDLTTTDSGGYYTLNPETPAVGTGFTYEITVAKTRFDDYLTGSLSGTSGTPITASDIAMAGQVATGYQNVWAFMDPVDEHLEVDDPIYGAIPIDFTGFYWETPGVFDGGALLIDFPGGASCPAYDNVPASYRIDFGDFTTDPSATTEYRRSSGACPNATGTNAGTINSTAGAITSSPLGATFTMPSGTKWFYTGSVTLTIDAL